MAVNPALSYGYDLGCYLDADAAWSAVSGVDLVRQDAFHRVTTTSVLGPGGTGWGRDCRELLGMKASEVASQASQYEQVLVKDERVESARVTLTPVTLADGRAEVFFSGECMTAEGPFEFVFPVSSLTNEAIEGQANV